MPPRTTKIRHDDQTRAKIQAAQIINRMHSCVMGEIVLDAQQVSCAKTLLNKVLPDLSSVAMESSVTHEAGDSIKALMDAVNGRTRTK